MWTRAEAFAAIVREIAWSFNGSDELPSLYAFAKKYGLEPAELTAGTYAGDVTYTSFILPTSDAGEYILIVDDLNMCDGGVAVIQRTLWDKDDTAGWDEMLGKRSKKAWKEAWAKHGQGIWEKLAEERRAEERAQST